MVVWGAAWCEAASVGGPPTVGPGVPLGWRAAPCRGVLCCVVCLVAFCLPVVVWGWVPLPLAGL